MQNLTTTETNRLRTLHAKVENARNFTTSVKAIERLDAYIERLLAKGRSVDQIIAVAAPYTIA